MISWFKINSVKNYWNIVFNINVNSNPLYAYGDGIKVTVDSKCPHFSSQMNFRYISLNNRSENVSSIYLRSNDSVTWSFPSALLSSISSAKCSTLGLFLCLLSSCNEEFWFVWESLNRRHSYNKKRYRSLAIKINSLELITI